MATAQARFGGRIVGVAGLPLSGKTSTLLGVLAEYLVAVPEAMVALVTPAACPMAALAGQLRLALAAARQRDDAAGAAVPLTAQEALASVPDTALAAQLHKVNVCPVSDGAELATLLPTLVARGCRGIFIDDVAAVLPSGPNTSAALTRTIAQCRGALRAMLDANGADATAVVTLPAATEWIPDGGPQQERRPAGPVVRVGGSSVLAGLCDRVLFLGDALLAPYSLALAPPADDVPAAA